MSKCLLIDIETSPILIWAWGIYEVNALKVEKHSELISFAYKFLGDKHVRVHSLRNNSTQGILERLVAILGEADIVIGHNSKSFDIRMINAFLVHNGFKPTKPYRQIDTLQLARQKFKFASNHLNDLGEYLGCGKKVKTGGMDLWFDCMAGDKKAWKKMEEYNSQDVNLLEKVYEKLMPWSEHQPEVYAGMFCQKCGGEVQFRGGYENKTFIGKRYQCKSCFSWGVSNKRFKTEINEYIKN